MRLFPTSSVSQTCERVRSRQLPRYSCFDQAEKDTVTFIEEQDEVFCSGGQHVERRLRTERRCQRDDVNIVKLATEFHSVKSFPGGWTRHRPSPVSLHWLVVLCDVVCPGKGFLRILDVGEQPDYMSSAFWSP